MNGDSTEIIISDSLIGRRIVKVTFKECFGIFKLIGLEVFHSVFVALRQKIIQRTGILPARVQPRMVNMY